ncbi:hypothetical protein XENTR_v10021527 [Xenopus tropicalis]|nr:hypothetical protein XENTR_v10021527 [Xenopus tropicalis]
MKPKQIVFCFTPNLCFCNIHRKVYVYKYDNGVERLHTNLLYAPGILDLFLYIGNSILVYINMLWFVILIKQHQAPLICHICFYILCYMHHTANYISSVRIICRGGCVDIIDKAGPICIIMLRIG